MKPAITILCLVSIVSAIAGYWLLPVSAVAALVFRVSLALLLSACAMRKVTIISMPGSEVRR